MRSLALILIASVCGVGCGFAPAPATGVGDDLPVDAAAGDANELAGPCGSPGAIHDNFDDPTAPAMWNVDVVGGTVVRQNSRLVVTPTGTPFAGYIAKHLVALTGAAIEVEVPQMLDVTTNGLAELYVEQDNMHFVAISQKHGMLTAQVTNGVQTLTMSSPYDSIAHRFWRISELNAMLHFEASPDGVTWAQLLVTPTPAFVTTVRIDLGVNGDPAKASGSVAFDNLNTQVPSATWCKAATFTDDFQRTTFGTAWLNRYTSGGGCAMSINNGAHLDQNVLPAICYLGSSHAFDLTESTASALIYSITHYTSTWYTYLTVASDDGHVANLAFNNNQMCVTIDGGQNMCRDYVTSESYWRIREAAGMTVFETSVDKSTWLPVTSMADPFPLQAVEIRIGTLTKNDLSGNHIGLTVSAYNN